MTAQDNPLADEFWNLYKSGGWLPSQLLSHATGYDIGLLREGRAREHDAIIAAQEKAESDH